MKKAIAILFLLHVLFLAACGMVWRLEYTAPMTFAVEVRADLHQPATQPATQPTTQAK